MTKLRVEATTDRLQRGFTLLVPVLGLVLGLVLVLGLGLGLAGLQLQRRYEMSSRASPDHCPGCFFQP